MSVMDAREGRTSARHSAGRARVARRPAHSRGFTLLEALVAMTLLVLMLAVLTGSIRFASQSREVTAAKIDSIDNMRIAQDFLRQTLTQTHEKRWNKAVGRPYVFRGDREEVALAAPLDGACRCRRAVPAEAFAGRE